MFDIAPSELLLIAIVAIVVIGPKDMPLALRTAGRWIGKMRRMSNHLRSGFEAMIREAELEEMERKWREQNEAIIHAHPAPPGQAEGMMLPTAIAANSSPSDPPDAEPLVSAHAEAALRQEPELPLPPA